MRERTGMNRGAGRGKKNEKGSGRRNDNMAVVGAAIGAWLLPKPATYSVGNDGCGEGPASWRSEIREPLIDLGTVGRERVCGLFTKMGKKERESEREKKTGCRLEDMLVQIACDLLVRNQ